MWATRNNDSPAAAISVDTEKAFHPGIIWFQQYICGSINQRPDSLLFELGRGSGQRDQARRRYLPGPLCTGAQTPGHSHSLGTGNSRVTISQYTNLCCTWTMSSFWSRSPSSHFPHYFILRAHSPICQAAKLICRNQRFFPWLCTVPRPCSREVTSHGLAMAIISWVLLFCLC